MTDRNDVDMIEIPCPMCGGSEADVKIEEKIGDLEKGFDYLTESGGHFRINKCKECSMVYSSPLFSEETLERLYDEAQVESCTAESSEEGIAINSERYVKRLMAATGIVRGRFLDVGCGCGQVLKAAKDLGFEVQGIDPSGNAVEAVNECGLNGTHGLYSKDAFPEGHFDLISVIHVIDHVMDPLELLRTVRYHLRPGGAVLIATHNIDSLLARIMGDSFIAYNVQHVSYYTPNTLDDLLERAGLTPVKRMRSLTTYPLGHLAQNGIINPQWRDKAIKLLKLLRIDNVNFSFPFGNIEAVARKIG